jgi:hypothetical protein
MTAPRRVAPGRQGVSPCRSLDEAVEAIVTLVAEQVAPSREATIADLQPSTPARQAEIRAAIRPTVRAAKGGTR